MVAQATLLKDSYEAVYTQLSAVTTNSVTWRGQFPDSAITSSSAYPIAVLNSPTIELQDMTISRSPALAKITFTIEVFDDQPDTVAQIVDAIIAKIDSAKSTLQSDGLYMSSGIIPTSITDSYTRSSESGGRIKLFTTSLTVEYKFRYVRT